MNLDMTVIKDRSECRGLLFLESSQMGGGTRAREIVQHRENMEVAG